MWPRNNNNNVGNNNPWLRKNPSNDQRPPTLLESANMAEEPIPFYRPCDKFHEESTSSFARIILKVGTNQQVNNVGKYAPKEFDVLI